MKREQTVLNTCEGEIGLPTPRHDTRGTTAAVVGPRRARRSKAGGINGKSPPCARANTLAHNAEIAAPRFTDRSGSRYAACVWSSAAVPATRFAADFIRAFGFVVSRTSPRQCRVQRNNRSTAATVRRISSSQIVDLAESHAKDLDDDESFNPDRS